MSARAALRERRIEVRGAGAVRRPDLDEPGAGAPHDLGDAHATADLHELAPRDDDAAAAGEPDRERQGGRVVVRDEGVLGARERDEVLLRRAETAPPAAALAIELEQDRSRGSAGRRLDRGGRPRGPTEVRVDDDPGRVDDRDEPGAARVREGSEAGDDLVGELVSGMAG